MVPLPRVQEGVFHVEHAPVQEPPTSVRALLQQLVDLRVDDLRREVAGQLTGARGRSAPDTDLGCPPISADAEHRRPALALDPPDDPEGVLALAHQAFEAPGPKRPATAEEEYGLEQTRLARSIRPYEQVVARIEIEADALEAAELVDLDPRERHFPCLEPHRHDDVPARAAAGSAHQAAAVRVREADLDLRAVDGCQSVEQVVDVEANLELFALVIRPRPLPRPLPAPGCAPSASPCSGAAPGGCHDTSHSPGSTCAAAPGARPRDRHATVRGGVAGITRPYSGKRPSTSFEVKRISPIVTRM